MKYSRLFMLLFMSFSVSLPAHAGLVVIVSATSPVEHLSRDDVINIFMGRYRKLPDGSMAYPLDVNDESPERREFYKKLLDKSIAEINAYWSRLMFSGRTTPPKSLPAQDVLDTVARAPGTVGYVDRGKVRSSVKVVYELPD